jgi:tRNA (mo5U34)-methyltransferase
VIVERAERFRGVVRRAKHAIGDAGFDWYPYDTLSAFSHLDRLLTGANRAFLSSDGAGQRVLDLGCGDGELAFFLETLGYHVVAIDHPLYNHSGMRAVRALKAALSSSVEIHELDLDRPFTLPHDTYDLVFFLGILYHLRNPFYVLEEVSRRASHCFLSTRVARRFPNGDPMPSGVALAYLLNEDELNQDNSNYFIFSEAGLRVMLQRAHWEVRDFASFGDTIHSDPVRPDRDERVFCYLQSRHDRLANVELLEGWHESEETGWRWTAREFSARVPANLATLARVMTMQLFLAGESIERLGPITLSASVNGRDLPPAVYATAGLQTLVRTLDRDLAGRDLLLRFRLSGALPPDESDTRERGIIVGSIAVE